MSLTSEPQSRAEGILEGSEIVPESRVEKLLSKLGGSEIETDEPQSRIESLLLSAIANAGPAIDVQELNVTENGTYTAEEGTAYSPVVVDVPVGLPNVVTGEFTAKNEVGRQEIDLSYTGNGYPVGGAIYVKGGLYDEESEGWYNVKASNAAAAFCFIKRQLQDSPTYDTSGIGKNQAIIVNFYKGTSGTSIVNNVITTQNFFTSTVTGGNYPYTIANFSSSTKLQIYVRSTSHGFMQNMTYSYIIWYSS